MVIPTYLILNILFNYYFGINTFLRDLQLLIRICFPFLIVSIALRYGSNYVAIIFRKTVIFIVLLGFIAFLLLFIGIDLFPYTSGRNWIGSRQLSSIFSEPALYGQMVVAYMFVQYSSVSKLKNNKFEVGIILFSLLLCQSAGAIFSILIWGIYLSLKEKALLPKIKVTISVFIAMAILIISAISLPNSRISQLLSNENVQAVALDRSGEIRVTNEITALRKFLNRDIQEIAFGLKKDDTDFFRFNNVDRFTGDIVGNGLIEIVLRYGLIFLLILFLFFYYLIDYKYLIYFAIFLILVTQIDGAIGKPWTWFYISILSLKLSKARLSE